MDSDLDEQRIEVLTLKKQYKQMSRSEDIKELVPKTALRAENNASVTPKKSPSKSPFFSTPTPSRRKSLTVNLWSSIPFPPLSQKSFGLIQELLANDPSQLLVAVIFLNRTKASDALPIFWALMDRYPSPDKLACASIAVVVEDIRHLGLQNQRAKKIVELAKQWVKDAPQKGRRYRTLHYPNHGDGKNIKPDDILDDSDERIGAWEIAHLIGVGDYALDSWRIFCRDKLRGVAQGYKGENADEGFEPEWKRVMPNDKELRAYLRWMWLHEGWEWDPLTGRKQQASVP